MAQEKGFPLLLFLLLLISSCILLVLVNGNPLASEGPSNNCEYERKIYQPGESFNSDLCTSCTCDPSGSSEPLCFRLHCETPNCYDHVYVPDKCCPVCPNGPNCLIRDIIISVRSSYTWEDGITCSCNERGISCFLATTEATTTTTPTTTTSTLSMPTSSAPPSGACEYNGQYYAPGESFKPSGPCTFCECDNYGSGVAKCYEGACYPALCYDSYHHPGECCATCPNGENCRYNGIDIPHGHQLILPNGLTYWCVKTGNDWDASIRATCTGTTVDPSQVVSGSPTLVSLPPPSSK